MSHASRGKGPYKLKEVAHNCHLPFASDAATGVHCGLPTHSKKGLFGVKLGHRHECRHCPEMQMLPVLRLLIVKFWNMGLGLFWG